MSIPIDRLSLLGALEPLRPNSDTAGVQRDNGFADKLDKALGGNAPDLSSSEKARELAQSLTLQMLQNSLSLAGDASEAGSAAVSQPLSSASSLVQAYRANLAASADQSVLKSAAPVPSQLQELQGEASIAPFANSSLSHADSSAFDSLISQASRKYGVDAGLIKAVIKAESNFNPQAVSHAGAQGLMQLMPATARSLGVRDSFDPEQNIMAGTRFLKDMLQRYNGDVDSALAAYNWGPGNVDRRPDRLPRETRDYLARVKQLYTTFTS